MVKPFGPHRRLQVELLEDRSLPSAGVAASLRGGILTVFGTDSPNTIVIRQTATNAVTLNANGTNRNFSGVQGVYVQGGNGGDHITMDTQSIQRGGTKPLSATLIGGTGNDVLTAGGGNDALYGGDGNDTIYGGSGNDLLCGNAGNDVVIGGSGNGVLMGGVGNNLLVGGQGNDSLYGGMGNDTLIGGAGNNQLDGGGGQDSFRGGSGFNVFHDNFGNVNPAATQASPDDIVQGESGTCVILASLAAVADSGVNLAGQIRQVGTNLYSVPLYRPGTGWITQTVYFDGTWTDNDPMLASADDIWVLLYQRAYLQEMGVNWNDPNQAQWPSKYGDKYQQADSALVALTGSATWHSGTDGLGRSDLNTLTAVAAGNVPTIALTKGTGTTTPTAAGPAPTIALTKDTDLSKYGLVSGHAYTVLGVTADSGGAKVTLRNPWGGANDGVVTVSWDVFSKVMQGFAVA